VTSVKLRRGPCDDNRDFKLVVRKAHSIKPIKVGIGDKGYDDEKNHVFLREELHADSIIPARYQDVQVWRTRGRYRKEMKRGYSKKKYHQRSKDETVFPVIKRTMGDEVRSVSVKGPEQRDEVQGDSLQRGEDSKPGLVFGQRVSTEPMFEVLNSLQYSEVDHDGCRMDESHVDLW
jgi:hypothetical protein